MLELKTENCVLWSSCWLQVQVLYDVIADRKKYDQDNWEVWCSEFQIFKFDCSGCSHLVKGYDKWSLSVWFYFAAGHSVQFVVTVLSHDEQTSSSGDRLSYYQLTPESLNSVIVVIGTPSNLLNDVSPVISPLESTTQNFKPSIADLG